MGYFCFKKTLRELDSYDPSPNSRGGFGGGPNTRGGFGGRSKGIPLDDPIRSSGTWGDFPTTFKFETWWASRPLIGLPKFSGKTWQHILLGSSQERGGHLWVSVINDRRIGKTAFPASWGPVEIANATIKVIAHYFSIDENQDTIDMSTVLFGRQYILTVTADGRPESVKLLVTFRFRDNEIQVAKLYALAGDGVFELRSEVLKNGKSALEAIIYLPLPK